MKKFIPYFLIFVLTFSLLGAYQSAQASVDVWQQLAPKAQKVDSSLQAILDNSAPGDMLTVIVTLDKQADLSQVNGADRAARLQGVIQALQATANGTQGRLTGLLNTYRSQGLVDSFTPLWVFNGFSVTATVEVINTLAQDPDVYTITPDNIKIVPTYGTPEANVSLVNAPTLWDQGYTGQGVVVASLDSGVDATHPDLSSRWRGGTNSWYDPYGQHSTPVDLNGHGTWTTGIMVGGDAGGTSIGVAPDAQWIAVKIFNDQGGSTATAIHQGFQWLLDPDGNPNTADAPQVVNNSWTYANPGCYLDFELDLETLRAAGILPIFAAGNGGPYSGTSYSPANNPAAFAVGAVDNNDQIYAYSSRGPSTCGGSTSPYPEMVAPGVNIRTTALYGIYTTESGTSLAAPHVAGGLALLLSVYPNLDAGFQADALINSAVDLGAQGPDDVFGYGRLDLSSAFDWITSNPPSTPTPTPTPLPTATPTPTPTIQPDVNLALNQPVTVSSSEDTAHDGGMAVDGDLGTYWQSKQVKGRRGPSSEWITVDLGSTASINQVVLEWDANYATSYTIQVSDDATAWSTVFSTASENGGNDTVILSVASARYVRMESTVWNDAKLRNWLREFEVIGISNGSTPTSTPEPTPTQSPTGTIHIGDLSGFSSTGSRNRWDAVIIVLVHDSIELPVEGVSVNYSWTNGVSGNGTCTTNAEGSCTIQKNNLKANVSSVSLTVL
ncbi:MAG: S8 family serine peptidase, partial [Anaerolineales bacterium]